MCVNQMFSTFLIEISPCSRCCLRCALSVMCLVAVLFNNETWAQDGDHDNNTGVDIEVHADTDASVNAGASSDVNDDESQAVALDENEMAGAGNVFAEMDLEQLMDINVTSVTGVKESWFQTPAALDVITSEDIRRSGHRSIPEALRLVPGLHVARINKANWAISARGFSSRFANKLQVLIDGRRLYDPLFSGVYWDVQDYVLEDIDRIEVVRGPGATLWGANAVNGVINVTTKSAAETQGLYLTGGGGNELQGFGAVRYGGKIDDDSHFRVYGKYRNFDESEDLAGGERPDDWDMFQTGFRFDFNSTAETTLTIQGDAYHAPRQGEGTQRASPTGHFATTSLVGDGRITGGNVLMRLEHQISEDNNWRVQAYYDRTDRTGNTDFEYTRNSFDIDFRHHFLLGDRHEILWGMGYRHDRDDIENDPPFFVVDPGDRSMDTFSAFVQDTITLKEGEWFAMFGSKFEENDFTGFEIQPNARLWWTPDDRQTIWGAISRPVRTPSRVEDDMSILFAFADTGLLAGGAPTGTLVPLTLTGDRSVESEELLSYELGYRVKLTEDFTLDAAGFYNKYDRLIFLNDNNVFDNVGEAETYGVELAANWHVADNWRLQGSYSFLDVQADDGNETAIEGDSPENQFQLRSELDITDDLEFNGALYYVDTLPAQETEEYVRLDLGLTWRPSPNLELALWGQNLLDPVHMEFDTESFLDSPSEIERSVYLQASFRF